MTPPVITRPVEYITTVTKTEKVAPTLFHLFLTSNVPIPFISGQYGSFLIDNNRRPFSFASLPEDPEIQFVISTALKGIGSTYVESLKAGDSVRLLAPYGRFTLHTENTRPIVFVATGAGIAPIRPLILEALRSTKNKVMLFSGNYNQQYMIFHDEFTNLAQTNPNFSYTPTLSNPEGAWSGATGFVTHTINANLKDLPAYDFYICGSPAMVTDMLAILEHNNVPKTQIYREAFI